MTNKLPAFFEKYFDQKFSEVAKDFADLKIHVNDEIQLIRETIQKLERNQFRSVAMIGFLGLVFIIHDLVGGRVLDLVLKIFGV